MKKSILLINKSGLNEPFKNALEQEGFIVKSFYGESFLPFRRSLVQKFTNIIRRFLFDDKNYLLQKEQQFYDFQLVQRSKSIMNGTKFDYTLFFRADLFPSEMIANIRKISSMMISYQYDGMEVSKKILNYSSFFDRLFVFDPGDYKTFKTEGFLPLTNCWFSDPDSSQINKLDFFYIGVGIDDRKMKIQKLQNFIKKSYSLKAFLTIPFFRIEEKHDGIEYTHQGLSYSENMNFVKSSKVLIDFKLPHHDGLSFRFFEAMNYQKKLITNNASVINYDFYDPNNIFITDFDDFSGLEEFMNLPYRIENPQIIQKYGFSNWIKYVLNIEPHEKINLPECK